jgi:voltage-dependent calcium channel L type alpha-1D
MNKIKRKIRKFLENRHNKNISLYLFKPKNKARVFFLRLVTNTKFDYVIVILILISSIFLAFDNPLNNPNGTTNIFLKYADIVFTIIFAMEAFMKIVSYGFFMNGKDSYIRNPWNILDFFIVVTSIISISLTKVDLSTLKILRLIRVLRPLRVISRNEGLKVNFSDNNHNYIFIDFNNGII